MLTNLFLKKSYLWIALLGLSFFSSASLGADDPDSDILASDSVRTNFWLCETLMLEAVEHSIQALEPAPGAVRLESKGKMDGLDLLGQAVFEVLSSAGYEVFSDVEDTARQAAVDYVFHFGIKEIKLSYPEVGRTLGIWRQWVDRDLRISVDIRITNAATGQILFNDIVTRQFADRIPGNDLGVVNSGHFSFTEAEASGSGWHRRLEEVVVVGSLAGMIAVYFANTGN